MLIPVGSWAPDLPDFSNPGALEALNVSPASQSYKPFPAFASLGTSALTARCQGAFFARKTDGSGVIFAGDATKLYRLSSLTFSDVSRTVGGAYAALADGQWRFAQFGQNVIAVNGFDAPQTFNVDTDTNFSALAGSPPIGTYICIAGDFVMQGNIATQRNRIQWSAINNSADWAISQQTESSRQDLPDGGFVQGIVGIEYAAIIFQEFAIRRASYEGPPLIFRFSKITDNLGCTIPGSIANYRDLIFWCDRSGFFMMQGGSQITPIGEQRVNNEFWAAVDSNNLPRVYSAIDPTNNLYIIGFPDTSATNGNINHLYIYNWAVDRWAHVQPGNLEMLFSAATQTGFTLEQLDSISSSIDALPFSLDSAVWTGIARRLTGGFGTDHKLGFFNGANLAATVDTTEVNLDQKGGQSLLRSIRAQTDGGSPTVAVAARTRLQDAVTFGSDVAADTQGRSPQRVKGRYHRARVKQPAGATWTHIQGVDDLVFRPGGKR